MKRSLPFHYDVDVYCECPIFYKLAVMKNHQNYDDWLFNHGGVFMDGEFNTYLGRFGQRYRMEDFSPLLEFIPVDYRAFQSGEDLIRAMVQILSEGDYVLLEQGYPNKNTFIPDELWLHETVFYAIDTKKKTACSPDLRNGHFSEREQSFEEIIDCHELMLKFYEDHACFAGQVREHAFPMCRIRLRHDTREEANMLRFFTCWNRISPRAKQPRITLTGIRDGNGSMYTGEPRKYSAAIGSGWIHGKRAIRRPACGSGCHTVYLNI